MLLVDVNEANSEELEQLYLCSLVLSQVLKHQKYSFINNSLLSLQEFSFKNLLQKAKVLYWKAKEEFREMYVYTLISMYLNLYLSLNEPSYFKIIEIWIHEVAAYFDDTENEIEGEKMLKDIISVVICDEMHEHMTDDFMEHSVFEMTIICKSIQEKLEEKTFKD